MEKGLYFSIHVRRGRVLRAGKTHHHNKNSGRSGKPVDHIFIHMQDEISSTHSSYREQEQDAWIQRGS